MAALDRKLIRDLGHMKGQAIAIGLVIACGAATLTLALSTLSSLQAAMESYYEEYRFADAFVHAKRAPAALGARLAEVPGVRAVQTRIVADVNLDLPGFREPAVGRLISIDPARPAALNALHLRRGRMLEAGRDDEILAGEPFADAHGLVPGDRITAILNGRRERLRIVGIVLSPEFIYQLKPGEIVPDNLRYGVFWMAEEPLAAAFDLTGAFNDAAFALERGANAERVRAGIDALLDPWGGLGAYGRDDQASHRYVSDELSQLRTMAAVPPSIFLSVAAFLLNVVLSRIIATQREQIAALKAFGYSSGELGLHYLKMVLVIAIAGVALGMVAGAALGRDMTEMYTQFFRFPVFEFVLPGWVVVTTTTIGIGAATLGAISAVRRAAALPPAEAMRPEPPARYRATIVERLGLQRLLPPAARMVLRHLERRPIRALLSIIGIAMAGAVLVLGAFVHDAINELIEHQFHRTQRHDVSIALVEPRSTRAVHDIAHLPGVRAVEPYRTVAARLRRGHHERRLAILGLDSGEGLHRMLDADGEAIDLPPEGLVISEALAERLGGAVPGDELIVEALEGDRPVRIVRIERTVRDYIGLSAYMRLDALNRMMHEPTAVSGAFITADPAQVNDLYQEVKATPQAAGVTIKVAAIRSFMATLAETLLRIRAVNVIFATIIAFGVVYNSARISLSERARDLASLRVLGFTRGEISAILLGELGVLIIAAIPLGLLLGYGLAAFASVWLQTESHRMPLVVAPPTFAFAAAVVLVAGLISGLIVRRRLDHLDLVAVLKTRD